MEYAWKSIQIRSLQFYIYLTFRLLETRMYFHTANYTAAWQKYYSSLRFVTNQKIFEPKAVRRSTFCLMWAATTTINGLELYFTDTVSGYTRPTTDKEAWLPYMHMHKNHTHKHKRIVTVTFMFSSFRQQKLERHTIQSMNGMLIRSSLNITTHTSHNHR